MDQALHFTKQKPQNENIGGENGTTVLYAIWGGENHTTAVIQEIFSRVYTV